MYIYNVFDGFYQIIILPGFILSDLFLLQITNVIATFLIIICKNNNHIFYKKKRTVYFMKTDHFFLQKN